MANGYTQRVTKLEFAVAKLKTQMKQFEVVISSIAEPKPLSSSPFSDLPQHLRKSYLAIANHGECDALAASAITKRKRAAESRVLNRLVDMGWLGKKRVAKGIGGPKAVFFVLQEAEEALTALA